MVALFVSGTSSRGFTMKHACRVTRASSLEGWGNIFGKDRGVTCRQTGEGVNGEKGEESGREGRRRQGVDGGRGGLGVKGG